MNWMKNMKTTKSYSTVKEVVEKVISDDLKGCGHVEMLLDKNDKTRLLEWVKWEEIQRTIKGKLDGQWGNTSIKRISKGSNLQECVGIMMWRHSAWAILMYNKRWHIKYRKFHNLRNLNLIYSKLTGINHFHNCISSHMMNNLVQVSIILLNISSTIKHGGPS